MKQITFFLKRGFILLIFFSACKNRKIKTTDKFLKAKAYYEEKKYHNALALFRDVMQAMVGKDESVESKWMMGQCFLKMKNYKKAAIALRDFYNSYPNNSRAEEALYLAIDSLSRETRAVCLDQRETLEAIEAIEEYTANFSYGEFKDKVEKIKKEMVSKIDLKTLSTIKVFFDLKYYNAVLDLIDAVLEEVKKLETLEDFMKIKTEAIIELTKKNKLYSCRTAVVNYLEFLEKIREKLGDDNEVYKKYLKKFWNEISLLK